MTKSALEALYARCAIQIDTFTFLPLISCVRHCGHFAICTGAIVDDDDEGRINFSVALSPKTTRTRNNKPKQ